MRDVIEVEVQPGRRSGANDFVAVEHHELAVGKQLDVLQIVRGFEALGVVQRRKTHALQLLELSRVLRSRLEHDEPVRQPAVVPHHRVATLYMNNVILSTR